jgi:putative SOS response-associated peptidase YedK
MCYHFADDDTEEYIIWYCTTYGVKKYIWRGSYYINAFDHSKCLVHAQGRGELQEMEWGLIPFWIKSETEAAEIANRTQNAKCETVFELPSYRHCIKNQKCLIFGKYFFEWRHITEKNKIPYLIGIKNYDFPDQFKPFTFGGIYDRWVNKETAEVKETFSIITTPANSMMELIHNSKKRMPLIIPEESQQRWLTSTEPDEIKKLMIPFPSNQMMAYPISKNISKRGIEKNIPETLLAQEYEEVSFDEFM